MHDALESLDFLIPDVLLGPAPCDVCRFRERCGALLLACEAYAVFVRDVDGARWEMAPRAPTRAGYLRLFTDKTDKPKGSQLRWV